ncbi:putative Zn-peptidase, M28 family (DUF2172 domain) [Campylobacter iguaniorum]|uniref:DUF4910 domain-containing protein n=1 Tax=Campylobacter iguaniorum TaxID=1244531 RepID=UPI00073A2EBC|nr:DUF4910 domain-containing protein [Campylobacter iguaniorum]ALV23651.1 putative Zn-peptidase, M28 family (DUF2172 domain) [Campylobacter iguaniorum]
MIDYTKDLDFYLKKLFSINRSITGDANRQTLKILQDIIPLNILEYKSGEKVYDWTIPDEWNARDAWIKNSKGEKVIDFKKSNLHLVSYSIPLHKKNIKLNELKSNLHFLQNLPSAIPYRTSYYNKNWGFCLSYNDFKKFFNDDDEEYEIFIDTEFKKGSLSSGELLIPGKTKQEYLISCYICHPSMANDSLSGILVSAFLAKELLKNQSQLEHSYRFIFVPETIGAIAYCANNEKAMKQIKNGLVITTCGGGYGKYGYKQSWQKENCINTMVEDVFVENNIDFITYPFDIHGSDERQYSSQGFRINCASITKDKYYEYKEYHTSLDNLDFVKANVLNQTLNLYLQLINKMDKNIYFKNLYPNCEVMLSKYDLYPKTGGAQLPGVKVSALDIILYSLFYMDGNTSLYEISKKISVSIEVLFANIKDLIEKNIIVRI